MVSSLSRPLNWRNILWLAGSLLLCGVGVPVTLLYFGVSLLGVLVFLASCVPAAICITAGYHRLFSHRSYDASAIVRFFYLVIGAAAFEGSALEWARDHRRHHRSVDTDQDPYSIEKGFFFAHMGWLFRQSTPARYEDYPLDLRLDPLVGWQHRYYLPLVVLVGLVLPTIIGHMMGSAWQGFLYGGVLRAVVTQHSTFLINSLSHFAGTRPFSLTNSARDNILMAFLAHGEGYHNFHHRFQTDYRNGYRWYHWDPTKWLIQSLRVLGLVRKLRTVPLPMIETTRMQTVQLVMGQRGIVVDRLSVFREKALAAQERWGLVREEYVNFKKSVSSRSSARRNELRTEIKLARIEFRAACRQWYAYARSLRTQPLSYQTV